MMQGSGGYVVDVQKGQWDGENEKQHENSDVKDHRGDAEDCQDCECLKERKLRERERLQ